jgi:hypothetical protein
VTNWHGDPLPDPLPELVEAYPHADDPELEKVFNHLKSLDADGSRMAAALRRALDLLLDGQHTGRYRWDELHKTEKTHCGTMIEIGLQREFDFADGDKLDYEICGVDVDCKYAQDPAAWMIPPEAVGKLLLGLWANDNKGLWSAGLVRASEELLTSPKGNRDRKRQLTRPKGRSKVRWLFHKAPLPENTLLRLSRDDLDAIFKSKYGAERVRELFRRAQGRRVSRTVVATVAQQEDYMARVRDNGEGARSKLRPEGIVIFGHYGEHARPAVALGLPEPGPGEFVSARLARRKPHHENRPYITLNGAEWVVATPDDPVEEAPKLPKTSRSE